MEELSYAVVHVDRNDDVIPWLERPEDRSCSSRTRRKGRRRRTPFQGRKQPLERAAVGVIAPGVNEALGVAAVRSSDEGGRQMDRRCHCTGGVVDPRPPMNRQCLHTMLGSLAHINLTWTPASASTALTSPTVYSSR